MASDPQRTDWNIHTVTVTVKLYVNATYTETLLAHNSLVTMNELFLNKWISRSHLKWIAIVNFMNMEAGKNIVLVWNVQWNVS